MSKVWLVTGSGSGLGRDIAEAVLAAGDRLVATARKTEQLQEFVAKYGEQVLPVQLDVTDEQGAKAAVQAAVERFGRLDVLVNNAGYGTFAPFEQMSAEDFQAVMDTNFYGVVYTTRAALPVMRKQRSGWILQVSSIGGRITVPGNSPYHAAKWAVGGFSESISHEVEGFGIKVCTLEPGGIRTNWARRARQDARELLPDYEPVLKPIYDLLQTLAGSEESDPKKIAQVVLKLANSERVPRRLTLGIDAAKRLKQWEAARASEAEEWRELTESTVFPDAAKVPEFKH